MTGAGLLPVSVFKGKLYFLFGRENKYNDTPGWSDFGGGVEKGETIEDTNLREIEEETCGFIHRDEIIDSINKHGFLSFTMSPGGRDYFTTLVKIPYDKNMPILFNKSREIINKYVDPKIIRKSVIFEKDRLRWFTLEEMKEEIHVFRPFYKTMIQKLLLNHKKIQNFV